LEHENREIRDLEEMKDHVESYYKELFGPEEDSQMALGNDFWIERGRFTDEEALELIKPFTLKELEEALKDMDLNASPGPDGIPVGFYKEFWNEIKFTMLEMFQDLHRGGLNLSRLNYGMISLIPKLKEANNIRQFRPVCLLNVDYKWFTKVLTLRLTPYAGKIISGTQTAFIPGRFILEGVVILHEILHELRVKILPGVILKLNFEKAYDKVRWSFMMEVLRKKNFPEKWVEWMKQTVEGGKVGINFNGKPGDFFSTHKGLRQGDPLSPLLFNLVSDVLATLLENAKEAGEIRGLMEHLIEGG
jgi:hypothetical protein